MKKTKSSSTSSREPANSKSQYRGANNNVAQNDALARENMTSESSKK